MAAGEAPIGPETLGDPEAAKVEQWWQPWPELLLPAPRLETANQLASVIDPETLNAPEVTERIEWWAPWSEPVPPLAAVAYSAAQAASGAAPQGQETLGDPEEAKQAHWWRTWPELLATPCRGVLHGRPGGLRARSTGPGDARRPGAAQTRTLVAAVVRTPLGVAQQRLRRRAVDQRDPTTLPEDLRRAIVAIKPVEVGDELQYECKFADKQRALDSLAPHR